MTTKKYLCVKCLKVSNENLVERKYRNKPLGFLAHQCSNCGSYSYYSGGKSI